MTYVKGAAGQAADFNALAGLTGTAAANSAAATSIAGYLWGIGYGDRGYGQTAPALSAVSAGKVNQGSAAWQTLITVMNDLATWQGSSITIPATSAFNAGVTQVAQSTIATALATLDTNRLNYSAGNMTLTSSVITSTRASTWGAGGSSPADQIQCIMSVTFASEDATRFFFNTGGEIRLALAHPNTSTPQDTAWNTILSNFVLAFRADGTARLTGSYGVAQAIGYFQLTTSYQTIINGSGVFTSPYASNSFLVEAAAASITGANGAKGSQINFRITLIDGHTNSFYDVVQSGTNAVLSHLRAGAGLATLPAAPTCAITTGF